MESPILQFGDKLYDILVKLSDNKVAILLLKAEGEYIEDNKYGIDRVDVSSEEWYFDARVDTGDTNRISCNRMITYILGDKVTPTEIQLFINRYNRVLRNIRHNDLISKYDKVEVGKFSYNPEDVRNTFLSLTTKTYPHGHENEVLQFLPKDLKKDSHGNYYKIIGSSKTMFTSHLDTADRTQDDVTILTYKEGGDDIFITDNKTILGADDKSGVAVLLYMMHHNIPGIYYFFIGEERGGIGSNALADDNNAYDFLSNIERCVSFDRRNYNSVITSQMGRPCCSMDFAKALSSEFTKNGMNMFPDDTGIYTDSASFMDLIPECTNISVGYFNEHTGREMQNISFLERLCRACIKINWESLPSKREVGLSKDFVSKNKDFVFKFKKEFFRIDAKLASDETSNFIKISFDDGDIKATRDDLVKLNLMLNSFNIKHEIEYDYQYLIIKLI